MLSYGAGVLALVPLLERLDCKEEGTVTLRLKDLELGGVRFLSGAVRLQACALGNGKH
ncbi:MAG: hypothetical protein QXO51_05485 [Halobacteria archaeon]